MVHAYHKCTSLVNVSVGSSVETIGEGSFADCYELASVTIGSATTEIGSRTFSGCTNLTSITSLNTTPPTLPDDNFTEGQYTSVSLYVPQKAIASYQSANTWKNFTSVQAVETSGIADMEATTTSASSAVYDLQGHKHGGLQKGVNIVHYSDGTASKVVRK